MRGPRKRGDGERERQGQEGREDKEGRREGGKRKKREMQQRYRVTRNERRGVVMSTEVTLESTKGATFMMSGSTACYFSNAFSPLRLLPHL